MICCFAWLAYIIINGLLLKNFGLSTYYFTSCFFLFFCLVIVFQTEKNLLNTLFPIILSIAALEALICLFQFFKIIDSYNTLFLVTGTWVNPNVIAMFIALAFPIGLYFFFTSNQKKLCGLILLLLLGAILLLQCRTALIGLITSTILQLNDRYNILSMIINKRNRIMAVLFTTIAFGFIIKLGTVLYESKKASAEGRRLIWKVSTQMIAKKPLIGYGYGNFETNYNLNQANYIKLGYASVKELENAGPVNMAYNEFLQNAVDGGLLGLSFLIIAVVSTALIAFNNIYRNIKNDGISNKENRVCFSAFISFLVMSTVNFTIQAIPVFCLFIIYSALLQPNSLVSDTSKWYLKTFSIKRVYIFGVLLVLVSTYLTINTFGIAQADYHNKIAYNYLKVGKNEKAYNIINSIDGELDHDSNFWINKANILYSLAHYKEALVNFNKAKQLSSSPNIFMKAGNCYIRLKMYDKAATEYQQAVLLHPTRFVYRYALMNAYQAANNKEKLLKTAREMVALKPKIPSQQANNYKNAAWQILVKLNPKPLFKPQINDTY